MMVGWLAHACGGSAAPPAPTALPPITGPHSIAGILVSNQTRAPIAGATLTLLGGGPTTSTVTSGPAGDFTFASVPVDRLQLTVSAPGYLERVTALQVTGSRHDLMIDVIENAPPFSLDFFRQFARDSYDTPAGLARLLPWSTDPRFYVQTIVENSGEDVPAFVVEGIRRIFINAVPELSAGLRKVGAFETGPDARPNQPGWVNVSFVRDLTHDGRAVGGLASLGPRSGGGYIKVKYEPAWDEGHILFGCESTMVVVADHEIVHTMGYFHTDTTGRDFHSGQGCTGAGRPDRVRYHAAVMYSRAYGNRDPDRDPISFVIPARVREEPTTVSCPAHLFR